MKVEQALSMCALFEGLNPAQRAKIAPVGVVRSLNDDELLFEENDQGQGFYVVMSGFVGIGKLTGEGRDAERCLAILAAGDFFGEMALLEGGLRSARAKALTRATVIEFDREEFHQFLEEDPATGNVILHGLSRILSRRIRATNELVADLVQKVHHAGEMMHKMRHALSGEVTAELRQFLGHLQEESHRLESLSDLPRDQQEELLGVFNRQLSQYSHNVQEMLTLVDLCYGEFQPQQTTFNAREMAASVLQDIQDDARKNDIQLDNGVPGDLSISTDGRLRLALAELALLLLHESPGGQTLRVEADGGALCLKLLPEGLSLNAIERILDDFNRLDNREAAHGKLGVGFALAKELIEANHGKIDILQSEAGTTVSVRLGR